MGVFDKHYGSVFATYRATLQVRDRIMGGTPKDPKIIEGWLRTVIGSGKEEEVRQAMLRTLVELGAEVTPGMSFEELERASEGLAASRNTNGFKRDERGLYVEGRTVKAMLKESVNILFAGDRWGRTKKGPRSFFAERVFVNPDKIHLGADQPSGIELFIGHVTGPKGPQSTLTYHEYVERPRLELDVIVLKDEITEDQWPQIWLHAQENGLGALRSQGFGRFDIEEWRLVTGTEPDAADRILASLR